MSAYLLLEAKISDPVAYQSYEALAQLAIDTYHGKPRACGGHVEVLEGLWTPPERLVVIEFDSAVQAKTFYNSPEYRTARAACKDAASMNILVVQGLPLDL